MDKAVEDQLAQITKDFYLAHAESFDDTRQSPWPAWDQVLAVTGLSSGTVLDLGCGNGRFAKFLGDGFAYTGVDSDPFLIAAGRQRYPNAKFVMSDLWSLPDKDFDLVVSFGVFHHIAGFDRRVELLKRFRGNVLAISLWQPKLLPNFENKLCKPIPGLEENDFLMGWKGDCSKPRYVHHFADTEVEALIKASGRELIASSNGINSDAANRYLVLR